MSLLSRFPSLIRRERELSVARLASTLTHSLGTPLQVIAGRAALAVKSQSLEESSKHIDIIQRKCSEITSLLWRVLEAARVEQERTFTSLDVQPFVQELIEALGTVGQERGVSWALQTGHSSEQLTGRLCAEDLRHALISLGLNVLAEAPDHSKLVLRVEKVEEQGLTPVYEAMFCFRFVRARKGTQDTPVREHVADPWSNARETSVDGQSIGWAAVYELARNNEARLEVTDREVRLDWPAVPAS